MTVRLFRPYRCSLSCHAQWTKGLFMWAGSVSKISPRHSFFRKNVDKFVWGAGLARLPRSRCLWWRSREDNFPARVTGTKLFGQNSFAFAKGPKWLNTCVLCISALGVCELALLVKSPQSYNSCERYMFMIHHFGCFFNFIPVTEPARLPGSYEEALSERGTTGTRSLAKSMHHFFSWFLPY